MDHGDILEAGGFYFIHNFDSGNLGHVERIPTEHIVPSLNHRSNVLETPDHEFNIWTRPDCYGTEFENGNRTWFYFGIQGGQPNCMVRLNIINLNKQGKMYSQGMAPVTRTLPGQPHWERIRDRPVHCTDENAFTLSFKYRTPENMKATTFFAFTYPFSFTELQIALTAVDQKFLPLPIVHNPDDIYYCRENLINTLEGRRTDLLTISSHHGITSDREERLKNLFPDRTERPFKFNNKKVIFISARVHPGETPSSFVFNGFLNLLLAKNDPIAVQLRKMYVFKLIPFLNPDGVARGHYRTDTRGVNLNRVYLNPSLELHPTIYAARALIRYYHFGFEKEDDLDDNRSLFPGYSRSIPSISEEILPTIDIKKKKGSATKIKDSAKSGGSPGSKSAGKSSPGNKSNTSEKLVNKVCELKLQEVQTSNVYSATDTTVGSTRCLLDDVVVRDCLGSEVHISKSDELSCLSGPNPLRQLRDTLKNSISLLIGNNYSGDASELSTQKDTDWSENCDNKAQKRNENESPLSPTQVTLARPKQHPQKWVEDSVVVTQDAHIKTKWMMFKKIPSNEYPKPNECLRNVMNLKKAAEVCKDRGKWKPVMSSYTHCIKSQSGEVHSVFYANCYKRNTTELDTEASNNASVASKVLVSGGDSREMSPAAGEERSADSNGDTAENKQKSPVKSKKKPVKPHSTTLGNARLKEPESGLFLYVDLHGHASKKGIFMYGNHFSEAEHSVECMLLPRIMSLNNLHFHFSSCNFTERNMYLKDRRDGMSREGSGRVAVLKATGLIRSYTLECNYNTGRLVNVLPPTVKDPPSTSICASLVPPKYTPHIFEEVGRSLGSSILDMTGQHPNSRLPASEHRTINCVREWLRSHMRNMRSSQVTVSRLRPKTTSPTRAPLYSRPLLNKSKILESDRKENTYVGAKAEDSKKPSCSRPARPSELSVCPTGFSALPKKSEKPFGCRMRCFVEMETKPKSLSTKRRNVLAIKKPNAGKARNASAGKSKARRAGVEEARAGAAGARLKAGGSFASRSFRNSESRYQVAAALASSSSETLVTTWEPTGPAKRRPQYAPAPPRLKKIRLKTAS